MKTTTISDTHYLLPETISKKYFIESLSEHFIVKAIDNSSEHFTILETFEWSLYKNKQLAIRHENQTIRLFKEENLFDNEASETIPNTNKQARFLWDFPDCDAKQTLSPLLNLRALSPIYQGILKIEHLNLQNDTGKTLVFCQLNSIFNPEHPRTPIMRQFKIMPLTGYTEESQNAAHIITQLGGLQPSQAPLDTLLSALGITPKPYTVKPQINIPAQMPARKAVSSIIAIMIEKQRLTESGIINDIDTEFLHHYRVAIRMVRSAITQLKVVFPENDVLSLKQRFATLARETNILRDLDVFILDKERYISLLPESMQQGLSPMFDDFQKQRQTEAKRISRWLNSKAYREEMDALESLFKPTYSAVETLWSEKPAIELAINKILKTYKKIYQAAIKITQNTADEEIHKIRIDCKKLRYLLYFFGQQFKQKKIRQVSKHLKSLQDTLGIFNDLTVQGEFLTQYLYQLEEQPKKDIMLIASLGGLISILYQMQRQERDNSIYELSIFAHKNNQQLFKETFVNPLIKISSSSANNKKRKQKK